MATTFARMFQRRATSVEWAADNPVLADGELGWDSTVKRFKAGDGVTQWSDLQWLIPEGSTGPFYVPEEYGALGDGVADDTEAVQDAMDAAYNAGGGTVLLANRYGWAGDLRHRGAITVRGVSVAKVLATDDEMDRGLVALDNTARYRYGQWAGEGASTDDNPGGLYDLVIDGKTVGGEDDLFLMQCVDGYMENCRVVNSAGIVVRVDGAQNTTIEGCLFGYAPNAAALSFSRIDDTGQGAGNIKVNDTYLATSLVLIESTSDPANFWPHDIFITQCLLEQYEAGNDLVVIDAGDFQFVRTVITNSNSGTPLPGNECLVQISQTDWPTVGTGVVFDSCYLNGGGSGAELPVLVKILGTGGVGNDVHFVGRNQFTNADAVINIDGGSVFSSRVSITGVAQRIAGTLAWYVATGGAWLINVQNRTPTPTRWEMPDDLTGTLPDPIATKREGDDADRFRVSRDGLIRWLDGEDGAVTQGSLGYDVATDEVEMGGTHRVMNAFALRQEPVFVTTPAQDVPIVVGPANAPAVLLAFFAIGATAAISSITGGTDGSTLQVILYGPATTGNGATWPANVHWNNGTAPVVPANGTIVVNLVKVSTEWYGSY